MEILPCSEHITNCDDFSHCSPLPPGLLTCWHGCDKYYKYYKTRENSLPRAEVRTLAESSSPKPLQVNLSSIRLHAGICDWDSVSLVCASSHLAPFPLCVSLCLHTFSPCLSIHVSSSCKDTGYIELRPVLTR